MSKADDILKKYGIKQVRGSESNKTSSTTNGSTSNSKKGSTSTSKADSILEKYGITQVRNAETDESVRESVQKRLKELDKKKKKDPVSEFAAKRTREDLVSKLVAPVVDDDIAPVKQKWYEGWFQKGALEDGVTVKSVAKTILGTAADAAEDIATGIVGIGEKVVDAALWAAPYIAQGQYYQNGGGYNLQVDKMAQASFDAAKKDNEELIKKDLYDEQKVAKAIISNPVKSVTGVDIEDISTLDHKSDSLAQSGGQLLATAGLQAVGVPWFVTSGVTSFGAEAENALNQGATMEEAGLSAAITAGAEILTEKISGGIKFGGKTLDDGLTKQIARAITDKYARYALKAGLDIAGEAGEEWLAEDISRFGQWLTYQDENTLKEMLFSEEAMDAKIQAAIGGGVLGGFGSASGAIKAGKQGVDAVSGLTANEQKVVDQEYKNRVAEAEKEGKVTQRDKTKIYDRVLNDMEKGYITTDTIESILGGESYKAYKDTVDSEDAIKAEFDTLNKMKQGEMTGEQLDRRSELKQMLEELKTTSKRNELKVKLGESVFGLVKGDRLVESYNEQGRRSQAFEADLTQYSEKQKTVIQKAIDSKILNNTNRTHEFVDLIAKISADKGVLFDFTNNQRLKESGFAMDGVVRNGYVTKDGVTLNINAAKSLNKVVGHEITHVLEGTEFYDTLSSVVEEYAKAKGEYDSRLKAITELYNKHDPDADPAKELTADLVGDYLFTDPDFINNLSTNHRNVFEKIYDEIKYMVKVATAGSEEARKLEKVKKAFEDAYRADSKASGETKHSLSYTTDNRAVAVIENDIFNGKFEELSESERVRTVKKAIKGFRPGIPVSGRLIGITGKTAEHFTNSDDSDKLRNHNPQLYEEKLNIAGNLDDVVYASTDYINEDLQHPRKDNITQFARGTVLLDIGGNKYEASVLVGYTTMREMVLYDVQDLTPTNFEIKKKTQPTLAGNESDTRKTVASSFDTNVAQKEGIVKSQPTGDPDIRYSLTEEVTDEQNEHGLDTKSEIQFSLSNDTKYMDNAIAKNNTALAIDDDTMWSAKAIRERIAKRMLEIKGKGLVGLPEDIEGNTYIANSSYDGTEENTTICPRSLASEAFVDAVSEYLGRPLTVQEQIYISQDLQGRSLTPECTYCYVATDRKAYRAFLGEYINQRDAVLQKLQENANADVSRTGELYKEFLNGRKDTNPMYKRFKMWVDAYKNGTPMVEASHLANINRLMGDIKEFGAELKPQIVDAMKYAQSASWAKKRVNYVAYNGHILNWKQDRINKLNSHYGLRMYSFSDFHPAFVLENMQMITDASVRGLKMLGYTKDTDFVDIFAPTGMNINVSTFGFESNGNVYENNLIGAEWEKAKALREQYPNVGVTFVATNDTLVEWALAQDWIDVVIPYHLVRTGAEVAKAFNFTNYTSESSDTKDAGWTKGADKKYIAPTEHNNDLQTYLEALQKNHLKPRFERFLNNPNYMKLVNECRQSAAESKPVQPVFNEEAAMAALAKLEANGYYQPIGGTVDRMYEIAAEVAENMTHELAPASSLSAEGEQDTGRFLGKDMALEEVAPVAEVNTAHTDTNTVSKNIPVTREEELFPDELAPAQTELDRLMGRKADLEAEMQVAITEEDLDAFTKANEKYEVVMADIESMQQEESDRVDSLGDADVPAEAEESYHEDTNTIDPFYNRDMSNIRTAKSYQEENPDAKPFFVEEASVLLGDIERSTPGQKLYNDEVYYRTGGEKGWMGQSRQTAEDIGTFKDQWGYSWDELKKAAKNISEGVTKTVLEKRLEFLLNDRMLNGYTDMYGEQIPRNQGYINLLNQQHSQAAGQGAFADLVAFGDEYAPMDEDVAPVMQEAPVVQPVKERYEAIRPKREVQPKLIRVDNAEDTGRGKQRKWVKTSTESEVVNREILPDDLDQELTHYEPISNKKTLGNANTKLDNMGYESSVVYFNSQFKNNRVSLDDVALGERLIQEAMKQKDYKTAGELIQNVAILGTELGQKVQALSIIKRLTPEGQLKMLQKTVDRGKTKGDKAYEGVTLTQDMIDKILSTYGEDGSYDQAELNKAVEDVKQQLADQMDVSGMEKVNAWRYLSMLGNPKTHIRNLVSNVAMKGTMAVKNAVARTVESIAPIETRTKTWRAATDDVKAFAKRKTLEMKDVISGDSKYSEDASIKEKRAIFKNKILNGIYEFNSDMLGKEDWWFSKGAFTNTLSEYLTANGIRTEQDIKKNPQIVEKGLNYAVEQAQIATFRQYSWLSNKINEIERKNAATQIAVGSVLPFKKTPINIAKTGLSYSPLGFAKTLTYDISQVKKGNMEASELIDHLAQNVTGSALTLVGYMLAQSGMLNGAGEDDKEGQYDYQLGEQSYSINIGDATYSLSWLSPVAMPLFVGANAYEQLVQGKEWNGDVVVETLAQTLDPLSEMSFISSLNDVLSSYDSGMQKFAGIFETAAQSYVSQFAPTLMSQVAQVMDDTKRSTKVSRDSDFKFVDETINKLKYKIPFLRETLEPSTDIWGNEVKQTEDIFTRAFETFLAPYAGRKNIATGIDNEIKALYSETGDTGLIPSVPYNYLDYKGEKYEMSAEEFTDYKKQYGQAAYSLLEDLFATNTYQSADAASKAEMVNMVYDYARDEAKWDYFKKQGIQYTNATKEGKEYYRENAIKGAILMDVPVDEYKFSVEYPEKYDFFTDNGVSYSEFDNGSEDFKDAWNWAYNNPEKYAFARAVTDDVVTYRQYAGELYDIKADKDSKGKSISGSRKEKVKEYIDNLDADYYTKIILWKNEYPSDDSYNYEIIDYLNSRDDISYEEMISILQQLDFEVDSNGNIYW